MNSFPEISNPYASLRNSLYKEASEIGVYSPEEFKSDRKQVTIAEKRQRRRTADIADDPRLAMTLTDVDGVLRWNDGYGYRPGTGLRRSRMSLGVQGRVVAPINFERLEPSKIGDYLRALDRKLTPACDLDTPRMGMRELVNGSWQKPGALPISSGRILIFIHGTFSKNEMFLEELKQTKEGVDLLNKIQNKKNYQQVLAFDHPTLSVSPILNAMDLSLIHI